MLINIKLDKIKITMEPKSFKIMDKTKRIITLIRIKLIKVTNHITNLIKVIRTLIKI